MCTPYSPMNTIVNDCYQDYSTFNQDKDSYFFKWQTLNNQNSSFTNEQNAFKYTQSSQIDSYSYIAKQNTYYGGGYVFKMIGNASVLSQSIVKLQQEEWINKQTAAVFVEFTIYNPNIKLFQYCSIVFEILSSGSFVNSAIFVPLDLTSADFISGKMLLGIAYLFCFVILMVIEGKRMYNFRLTYFKQFHNYIDLLVIAFSWTSFSMFLYRLYASYSIYTSLRKKGLRNKFINLQYLAGYDQFLAYFLGFCAFLVTLRFIKLLRFNKRIILFLAAFLRSLIELLSFSLVFLIVWLSFVQAIFLLMNSQTYEFSSFNKSMETCFQIILGKFNSNSFLLANSVLAPILFAAYNIVILFVMLNIFVTILIDHYNLTKQDENLYAQDPGLFNYIFSALKPLMFWRKESPKITNPVYLEIIDGLPSRFDDIMIRFNRVSFLFLKTIKITLFHGIFAVHIQLLITLKILIFKKERLASLSDQSK
jgi:polycystin 1L2